MVGVGAFWGDLGFLDAEFLENGTRYQKSLHTIFNNLLVWRIHQILSKTVNEKVVNISGDFFYSNIRKKHGQPGRTVDFVYGRHCKSATRPESPGFSKKSGVKKVATNVHHFLVDRFR